MNVPDEIGRRALTKALAEKVSLDSRFYFSCISYPSFSCDVSDTIVLVSPRN